jgi:hypothetical protein
LRKEVFEVKDKVIGFLEVSGVLIALILWLAAIAAYIYWTCWFISSSSWLTSSSFWHVVLEIILPIFIGIIVMPVVIIGIAVLIDDSDEAAGGGIAALTILIVIVCLVICFVRWGGNFNATTRTAQAEFQLPQFTTDNPINVVNKFDKFQPYWLGAAGAGGLANTEIEVTLSQLQKEKLERVFIVVSGDEELNSEIEEYRRGNEPTTTLLIHYYGTESRDSTRIFHVKEVCYKAPEGWSIKSYSVSGSNQVKITLESSHHGSLPKSVERFKIDS